MPHQLQHRQAFTLCALSFVPVFSATIASPIYPVMSQALNLSAVRLGSIASMGALATLLGSPFVGYLGDRHGAVRIMRPLLSLYAIGALLCAVSPFLGLPPYMLLLLGRSLQGFGELGGLQQGISIIVSSADGDAKGRLLSQIEASASAGGATGPLVGGLLAGIAWWSGYLVPALLMAAIILLLLGSFESKKDRRFEAMAESDVSRSGRHAGKGEFRLLARSVAAALSCFLLMFGLAGMQTFIVGYLVDKFSISPAFGGVFVSVHALAMSAAAFLSGRYISEKRAPAMVSAGLGGFAVMLMLAHRMPTLAALGGIMVAGGVACGLILPSSNLVGTAGVAPGFIARTTSFIYTLRLCGSMAGSMFFGWMIRFSYASAFSAMGVIILAGAAALYAMLGRTATEPAAA